MKPLKTIHNLIFESAQWPFDSDIKIFRVGTCEGQWYSNRYQYVILSFLNKEPGNGHLEDVFQWFEHSCKRDKKDFVIQEFFNDRFKKHCIEKRGFKEYGKNDLIKSFCLV